MKEEVKLVPKIEYVTVENEKKSNEIDSKNVEK